MDVSSIALQGITAAEAQLEAAASNLANAGASSSDGTNLDVVDIATEMVALMTAKTLVEVNLATLKTADQMQKALVDIKA